MFIHMNMAHIHIRIHIIHIRSAEYWSAPDTNDNHCFCDVDTVAKISKQLESTQIDLAISSAYVSPTSCHMTRQENGMEHFIRLL